MDFEPKYYTGYEQDDESSIEGEDEFNESDEECEKDFMNFLKSEKSTKTTVQKQKPTKKELSNKFEDEMNSEIDNLIEIQEKKYLPSFNQSNPESKQTDEDLEESDTDSEAELETGVRTKKKREHFTNDELFYDPNADDEDQNWINKQRKTCKLIPSPIKPSTSKDTNLKSILKTSKASINPEENSNTNNSSEENEPIEKFTNANSDAILNCPCCMSMVCMDCQRHEKYRTQFRAMFVFNCNVKQNEQLKYPKQKDNYKNRKSKKNQSKFQENNDEKIEKEKEEEIDIFKPVECDSCKTEIGVYDPKEEIYHFFNVLASHS